MIENIKSSYIIENMLKDINKRYVLNIFKYNKYFQSKLGFTKNDYLFEFINKIPDINLMINKNKFKRAEGVRGVIKLFKSLKKDILNKKILKKNIIEYLAMREDFCLSINDIYFKEIINKKIELGKKNIKIKFDLEEDYLSNEDIIDLVTIRGKNKIGKIKEEKYIEKKIEWSHNFIKKLEILLNYDIFISELYFDIEDTDICWINYKRNLLEFEENENKDLNNIVINFRLKRAELINKILEKNCKNIIKMNYLDFYKVPNNDAKLIFPLVDLDKFENLIFLGLGIFYEGDSKEELIYNFPNLLKKLNKLKSLKIKRLGDHGILNVNIQREILDELDVLKMKGVNWIIDENETFHFKNIKELHFNNCNLPEKYIKHKKYFFEELLKGNVSWEKLNKLKITSIYNDLEDIIKNKIDYLINKEIIYFFQIANLREGSEENSTSVFFQYFFNFILNNQNIYINTKKNCKNIEEFIIKIYDQSFCYTCYRANIVYERKRKNVDINIGPILHGSEATEESPLQYLNLDSIIIDPSLDSLTMNHFTINELKYLKKFISEQLKINEEVYKKYKNIYKELENNYNNNKRENILIKLKKDHKLISKKIESFEKNNESYLEKTISEIKKQSLKEESWQIKRLIRDLDDLPKNLEKDTDLNINDINDNHIFYPIEMNLFHN